MPASKKIAVLSGVETSLPFGAIGADVFPIADDVDLESTLRPLMNGAYGIIYIEEYLSQKHLRLIGELNQSYPQVAISIVPGAQGGSGLAKERLAQMVKKAVGMDMFSEK